MTSSTVCALAAKEKNTMAANTGKKKRTTLVNSINGVTRKSTSITPPNPTLSGNTPNGRDLKGEHLITRKRQHSVIRLLVCCQGVSVRFAIPVFRTLDGAAGSARLPV